VTRHSAADGRAAGSGRAWVLHPSPRGARKRARRADEVRLAEAVGLARAIDLEVELAEIVPVREARPATLVGQGKVAEIATRLAVADGRAPEVVVIDAGLTPVQHRNLEQAWGCKVLDRTALILEIFGARAHTAEGRLQVELAALTYQRSRLVRSWTHLERQRGALGFVGGPGESQLEADRRMIDERIVRIRRALAQVVRTRALQRGARRRVPYPVVALVGYTNAGKSTLFNRLTGAAVPAADRLFATLDPTMRAVRLPSGRTAILSDTVGFISDLPTDLIAAFRATLEEVVEADLVLHLRDAAQADSGAQAADVGAVLRTLGIDPEDRARVVEVYNKIDLLDAEDRHALEARCAGDPDAVAISARDGRGSAALLALIDRKLSRGRRVLDLEVDLADGAALAWLYRHGEVLTRRDDEAWTHLRVALDPADAARFSERFKDRPGTAPGAG
jgi:GTP-binding protein HflX